MGFHICMKVGDELLEHVRPGEKNKRLRIVMIYAILISVLKI